MTNDQKKVLKLFERHGGTVHGPNIETVSIPVENFLAFSAALEEKHRAKIAMLRERDKYYGAPCEYFDDHTKTWIPAHFIALAFSKVDREPLIQAEKRMPIFGTWNSVRGLDEKGIKAAYALFEKSLSTTQQDTDAFIAEVRAGERNRIAAWMDANFISHISANWLRSPSAELRASAAQPEGKEVK